TRRHITYAAVEGTRAAGMLAVTGVLALVHPPSFLSASLALSVVTGTVAAAGLLAILGGMPRPVLPRRGYLGALRFAVPFVIASMLTYTMGWGDRFILNYFSGPASVAVYVAAFAIARQPVDLCIGALNTYMFPVLIRAYAADGPKAAAAVQTGVMMKIVVFGAAMVAGLTLFAEPLATLLFPESYRAQVGTLIPLIAVGTFWLALKQFLFDNSLHVTRQNWWQLVSIVPPALTSITLGIVLIRAYGELGAAVAYCLVAAFAGLLSALVSSRVFAFEIPWRRLLEVGTAIFVASLTTWAICRFASRSEPAIVLVGGFLTFSVIYYVALSLFGISTERLADASWASGE
ncbi:MAG: lipopolysaccharide biosynthesis protein, partial [Thermomicrobiales bacterium]